MSELEKDLVFAGVDTRKDAHTLCLLDHMGRAIGTFRFAADAKGCDALAGKIGGPATCAGVGVEGTGSYGAGLTRRLLELGYCVYEVMVPGRARRKPGRPKSDPADAEAGIQMAVAMRQMGNYPEAVAAADQVLVSHPNNVEAMLEIARAHVARGQGFYAIEPARKAQALPLATGEGVAQFANHGVVARRQAHDEIVHACGAARLF